MSSSIIDDAVNYAIIGLQAHKAKKAGNLKETCFTFNTL